MRTRGWIALDIDGTITAEQDVIPASVVSYLKTLTEEEWRIAIATGRSVTFASKPLQVFPFPFLLIAQNGSVAVEMPHREVCLKRYLPSATILALESHTTEAGLDYVIYNGFEAGDLCYWRPSRFSSQDRAYLQSLQARQKESWHAVSDYASVIQSGFPMAKCFGSKSAIDALASRLARAGLFHATSIRDPFHETYHILLISDRQASKGATLTHAIDQLGQKGDVVIAAGDDENDMSLLLAADRRIAMSHAPASLKAVAHLIDPDVREQGIIAALQKMVAL
jgi:hydroxymethylpyrimidine pyrophosphatase-like HAD family hydrolase